MLNPVTKIKEKRNRKERFLFVQFRNIPEITEEKKILFPLN